MSKSSTESWTHTDLPAKSLKTTPALLWGQFSSPSTQSQTGAAPTRDLNPDLSPAAFLSQNAPTNLSSFWTPSARLVPLSLSLSQSLCLYTEINFHHFQLLSTSISTAPEQSTFPEKCQCMQISHTEHRECWEMIPRIEVITRQHTFSFY